MAARFQTQRAGGTVGTHSLSNRRIVPGYEVPTAPKSVAPNWLRIAFAISILIAVGAVLRRLVALAHPAQSGPPQLRALDSAFASHAAVTLAHIVPALIFVLLCPVVFLLPTRFRWAQRVIYPLGAVVGITAYLMMRYAVGGWLERSAVLVFNTLFLYSLARSFAYMRAGDAPRNRRWLLRAVGILLGIATTRPVMGIFFATAALTHLRPDQFFGIAFWIGFSINTIAVELWLRSETQKMQVAGRNA